MRGKNTRKAVERKREDAFGCYKPGVYLIRNTENGKVYVGSGSTVKGVGGRCVSHQRDLRKGSHGNRYLQRAWDKYGEESFTFEVLETCQAEDCLDREQYWIDRYESYKSENGYNINPRADGRAGAKLTEDQIQAMRKRVLEAWEDEEYRQLQTRSHQQYYQSPGARDAASERQERLWADEEHRDKVLEKMRSLEHRQLMSRQAEANWESPAYRSKMERKWEEVFQAHAAPKRDEATRRYQAGEPAYTLIEDLDITYRQLYRLLAEAGGPTSARVLQHPPVATEYGCGGQKVLDSA